MFSKLLAGSIIALGLSKTFAAVSWKGVNVAGFDFSCGINGLCKIDGVAPPLRQYGGSDGAAQMAHFSKNDGFNAYRLPVGWQFLVNNKLGANLSPANFAKYNDLVRACLATGAHCIIDIHNYARWNGGIIGQGGPPNGAFVSLWSQLAKRYAKETKVVMDLMNEPHDVDIQRWARTVQEAVTAIRKAGATDHYILLPGNGFSGTGEFPTRSAPALSKVVNLDKSKTNLIFDVHKYFDHDGSGTSPNCISDGIDTAFAPLANYLRKNHRRALLSEFGGGSRDQSCLTNICKAISYLEHNSDVYLGYIGWSAGSFSSSYPLSLTPTGNRGTGFVDVPLITKCFVSQSGESRYPPQELSPSNTPPAPKKQPGNSKAQPPGTPPPDSEKLPGNSKAQPPGIPPPGSKKRPGNSKAQPPGTTPPNSKKRPGNSKAQPPGTSPPGSKKQPGNSKAQPLGTPPVAANS